MYTLARGAAADQPAGWLMVICGAATLPLAAASVFVGIRLTRARASRFAVEPRVLDSLIPWMLLASFVCSHLVHAIFYAPRELWLHPTMILKLWDGHSSIAGFLGTLIGAVLWRRARAQKTQLMPISDLMLSVFPIAWSIGRVGCAIVHDHKGKLAAFPTPLTVRFPDGPHYDLGLLEMVASAVIAMLVMALCRKPRRIGTYTGLVMVRYSTGSPSMSLTWPSTLARPDVRVRADAHDALGRSCAESALDGAMMARSRLMRRRRSRTARRSAPR